MKTQNPEIKKLITDYELYKRGLELACQHIIVCRKLLDEPFIHPEDKAAEAPQYWLKQAMEILLLEKT
jgi:hypothetical protein